MDASKGGRVGPSPPPWKKSTFFPYRGPSYSCGDLFANFLLPFSMSMGGRGLFSGCPPLPTKILRVPCSGVVGNFSCGTLSWHYGHISYRYRSRRGGGGCLNEWSFIKG